jgi:hypothetical protein
LKIVPLCAIFTGNIRFSGFTERVAAARTAECAISPLFFIGILFRRVKFALFKRVLQNVTRQLRKSADSVFC